MKNKKRNLIIIFITLFVIIGIMLIKHFNSNVPNGWYLKNTYYYEDGAIGDYFSFYIYYYDKNIESYKNYKKVGDKVESIKERFEQCSILSHYKDWLWDDKTFDGDDLFFLKEYSKEKYDLYYYDKETKQLFLVEDHCD